MRKQRYRDQKPWPFRSISNFFLYTKYVEELRNTDRDKLEELREDVKRYGIDFAVEKFENRHATDKKFDNYKVKEKLKNKALHKEWEDKKKEREENQVKFDTMEDVKRRTEELKKKNERKSYDKNYTPKQSEIDEMQPISTKEQYKDLKVEMYNVVEKGAFVAVVLHNEEVVKVLVGEKQLDVNSEVMDFIDDYAFDNNIEEKGNVVSKPSQNNDFDIDISHVERNLGLDGNNESEDDGEIDLDDIF